TLIPLLSVRDINQRGQVLGVADNLHVAIWNGTSVRDLGFYGEPAQINARGEVVGWAYDIDQNGYSVFRGPFYWHDGVLDLLPQPEGQQCYALALNSDGLIAGECEEGINIGGHAVAWRNGVLVDLAVGGWSEARGVTNDGEVVIQSQASCCLGPFAVYRWR